MNKVIALTAFFFCFQVNSAEKFDQLYVGDLPAKAIKIDYKKNGNIKEVMVSSWVDRVKTVGGVVYRKFEQGYSYKKKKGYLKTYDDKGDLLSTKWSKKIDGGVSEEEVLVAFELFKNNKIVINHLAKTDMLLTIHGGFNFQDNKKCKLGKRCVHVFASTSEVGIMAHSIIRLSDQKVVYPNYDMQDQGIAKKNKRF